MQPSFVSVANPQVVPQACVVRERLIATVSGVLPGTLVFLGARELAFATVCDCWSTRMAGSFACACLGIVVGLAIANRVLDRLAPPA
jgi:hypothetical protein